MMEEHTVTTLARLFFANFFPSDWKIQCLINLRTVNFLCRWWWKKLVKTGPTKIKHPGDFAAVCHGYHSHYKTVVQEFTDSYTTKAVHMFHQNCLSSDRLALASPYTCPMSIQLFYLFDTTINLKHHQCLPGEA